MIANNPKYDERHDFRLFYYKMNCFSSRLDWLDPLTINKLKIFGTQLGERSIQSLDSKEKPFFIRSWNTTLCLRSWWLKMSDQVRNNWFFPQNARFCWLTTKQVRIHFKYTYRFKSEIPSCNKKLGPINKMYQMQVIVPTNGTVTAGARRGTWPRDAPAHDTLRCTTVNEAFIFA